VTVKQRTSLELKAMAYLKQLGVFVKVPEPGRVKTRLVPPLSGDGACRLYRAFVSDLFLGIGKLKKVRGTVFYSGEDPEKLKDLIPESYELVPQRGATLGERLVAAFDHLLAEEERTAVIIGSDSPDLPVQYLKRAFLKLKHKDVVLGPAADGGYYLVGLKARAPELFEGIDWGENAVLGQTLERIKSKEVTLSALPLWYDVDTPAALRLLCDMIRARRIEQGRRLPATEAVLADLVGLIR
jgi:rSAM/selenodomain-associated transferase 1